MSEEAAFLAVLKADPADDTARLVYADWLDEHDQPHKAEYLRAVVDVAREACAIQVLDTLAGRVDPEWAANAAARFALVLESFDPARKIDAIKIVREITGMGLAEAKQFVEHGPSGFVYRTTGESAYGVQRYFGPGRVERTADIALFAARRPTTFWFSVYVSLEPMDVWDDPAGYLPEALSSFRQFLASALGVTIEKATELTPSYDTVTVAEKLTYDRAEQEVHRCRGLRPPDSNIPDWFLSVCMDLGRTTHE